MSIYDVFKSNHSFNKEEWAAQKQAQRQEAYGIIDNTCSQMMTDGNAFRQYLEVQGRFDRYSVANAILVSAQMPEATLLRDYSKWKQNRIYINKNAQKITILEPGKEYTREDGSTATSFNAKVVYDISQTLAKDKVEALEPKDMRDLVSALIDASPVPFHPVEDLDTGAFYDSAQETIFICTGLSEEQLFVSMAKEVAAAVYDGKYNETRDQSEFKSYCVAYMISSKYDVGTQEGFPFNPLPEGLSGLENQDFRNELGTMRDVLGEITSEMYRNLEKNKPPKSKEQER
jgi:hypothetical protein